MNEIRYYCEICRELTFRTFDDNVRICQGCGKRESKKLRRYSTISFEDMTEQEKNSLSVNESREASFEGNSQYNAVIGRLHKLSKMEKRVIELLVEGKTNKEVAKILSISYGEFTTYLNRSRIKLK